MTNRSTSHSHAAPIIDPVKDGPAEIEREVSARNR